MLFEPIAVLCAGLFAGAALYINLVEHPARMTCGPAVALQEWIPSYRRATAMQVPLAIAGSLAAFTGWVTGAGRGWLLGATLLGSIVPFTLLVVFPTNRELLDPAAPQDLRRIQALLDRWNRLHAVRTALSVAAFAAFVILLRRT